MSFNSEEVMTTLTLVRNMFENCGNKQMKKFAEGVEGVIEIIQDHPSTAETNYINGKELIETVKRKQMKLTVDWGEALNVLVANTLEEMSYPDAHPTGVSSLIYGNFTGTNIKSEAKNWVKVKVLYDI